MNDTLLKFGYPNSVIKSYSQWSVLLRPQQVTLGSLILANHSQAMAFSDLEAAALTDLHIIVNDIESVLTSCFNYDKINYLMLMMIDPHVHFHVIPRYQENREFKSVKFIDEAWPGPVNLGHKVDLTDNQSIQLLQHLRDAWNNN